jgi:uncharacterized membrane protein
MIEEIVPIALLLLFFLFLIWRDEGGRSKSKIKNATLISFVFLFLIIGAPLAIIFLGELGIFVVIAFFIFFFICNREPWS